MPSHCPDIAVPGKFPPENSPAVSFHELMKIFLLYVIEQLFEIKFNDFDVD